MRALSFVLAAGLLFSMADRASADTILTYSGQDYTSISTGCTFIYPVQQSTCSSESAIKPEYTTSMALTIQIDLSDSVVLPETGLLVEQPFIGTTDVLSETINDGAQTLDVSSAAQTSFFALTFSNGNISGWDFKFVTENNGLGYVQTFSTCYGTSCGSVPIGDVAQQDFYAQNNCGDFAPMAGGDCPVHWSDYASTASVGSWSIVTTASEPSSFALLLPCLALLGVAGVRKKS